MIMAVTLAMLRINRVTFGVDFFLSGYDDRR